MIGALLGILSPVIQGVTNRFFPNPEDELKRQELNQRLAIAIMENDSALQAQIVEVYKLEAGSADPFVSRARPTFMYVMYALFAACPLGGMLSIFYPQEVFQAAENTKLLFEAIPAELMATFFGCFAVYSINRTSEKKAGVAK